VDVWIVKHLGWAFVGGACRSKSGGEPPHSKLGEKPCRGQRGTQKRESRAGPGGWTQVFTRQTIVHLEEVVKIIIYWEADFLGEKQGEGEEGLVARETRSNL